MFKKIVWNKKLYSGASKHEQHAPLKGLTVVLFNLITIRKQGESCIRFYIGIAQLISYADLGSLTNNCFHTI